MTWEVHINPDLLTMMLLYSLPQCFENFRCAIESRDELPTPETLRIKIIEEYDARKNDARASSQGAMIARHFDKNRSLKSKKENTSQKKPFKFKCHRCGKIGYKASDCYSKIEGDKVSKRSPEKRKMADVDDVCVLACAPMKIPDEAEVFQAKEATRDKPWYLDSGCTSHLCSDSKKFTHLERIKDNKLNLANNSSTTITGKGTVRLEAEVDGNSKHVNLENTLHVPDLCTNLLSVNKIIDRGFKVIFEKKSARIIDRDGIETRG